MLKTVFDSVIAKVIDMVESQISEIGEKGQTPKVRDRKVSRYANSSTSRQFYLWAASETAHIYTTD